MNVDADTPLENWNLPHISLILDEIFAVAPPNLFGEPAPLTVGELAARAQMTPAEVAKRLTEIAAMTVDIELSPRELQQWLAHRLPADLAPSGDEKPADLVLVDVREPWEMEICRIAGSIALHEFDFSTLLPKLRDAGDVVVICHHGVRSFSAAMFLRQQGVGRARNLTGGVEAWARTVDPNMARY